MLPQVGSFITPSSHPNRSCLLQDERAVALLLSAGASPCLSNNDMGEDCTLHKAACAGRPGLLRVLLQAWPAAQRDAAVNAQGGNGGLVAGGQQIY